MGQGPRGRSTSKIRQMCSRNEIEQLPDSMPARSCGDAPCSQWRAPGTADAAALPAFACRHVHKNSATVDPGEAFNTRGTTPETIPGTVCVSGRTRLLTGKSRTTSELSASHPRTSSAHAAVITDDRRIPKACDNLSDPGNNDRVQLNRCRRLASDHACPRRLPTDNAVRFPTEGSSSNRPDHRDNRWTLRIPTRNQSDHSATQRKRGESARPKPSQYRQTAIR